MLTSRCFGYLKEEYFFSDSEDIQQLFSTRFNADIHIQIQHNLTRILSADK